MITQKLRLSTAKLVSKLIYPLTDSGLVTHQEYLEITNQLKSIAKTGAQMPPVEAKLIDQKAAAEMLGVGLSNFKKLERERAFTFKRRMVGSSVRYRNLDIIQFIMADDDDK